jgi:hypothetical protein
MCMMLTPRFKRRSVAQGPQGEADPVLVMGKALTSSTIFTGGRPVQASAGEDLGEIKAVARPQRGPAEKTIEAIHEVPCMTIEVAKIKGSECRACDFDVEFLPLSQASRERWAGVYAARLCGVSLPAISVVQVGSLLRARRASSRFGGPHMGEQYIEANAQVWQVAGEVRTAPAMSMQLVSDGNVSRMRSSRPRPEQALETKARVFGHAGVEGLASPGG